MPEGRYLSLSGELLATTGGQTRALLMRNRLLAVKAGIEPVILTFNIRPYYPEVRESLRRQGQLVDGMTLLNIFEWYRDRSLDDMPTLGQELPPVRDFESKDTEHPDGTTYYTSYLHPRLLTEAIRDYRRPDGSVFLRMPISGASSANPPTPVVLVNASGFPVGSWPQERGWRQSWVLDLGAGADRVFLISDSRFALAHVVPIPDPRFHVLHLMHNTHVVGDQRWNSSLSGQYGPLMKSIPDLDGLVTLTRRQRADVAARYGATNNLFVVPNPVELPPRPEPVPEREARRFVIVSRLEDQKRLVDAVRAFALVVKEEPEAVLEIYGDGKLRIPLADEIIALGIQENVFLRGHDPRAREVLWTATAFLMTSKFEGYPLATLESMSHGCPVVSYDIKYGPQEQITDGVDGFLVPAGDVQKLADRIIQLARDPDLVRRMSSAAEKKAEGHDYRTFLGDWRSVLETAVRQKRDRTTLQSVRLTVTRLSYERPLRLPSALAARLPGRLSRRSSSARAFRSGPVIDFAGKLAVVGQSDRATLDDATVSLDAVSSRGTVVPVPISATRSEAGFDLAARIDPAQLFDAAESQDQGLRLRLRLVWNNSSWETMVRRSRNWSANYEICFSDNQELTLLHRSH